MMRLTTPTMPSTCSDRACGSWSKTIRKRDRQRCHTEKSHFGRNPGWLFSDILPAKRETSESPLEGGFHVRRAPPGLLVWITQIGLIVVCLPFLVHGCIYELLPQSGRQCSRNNLLPKNAIPLLAYFQLYDEFVLHFCPLKSQLQKQYYVSVEL